MLQNQTTLKKSYHKKTSKNVSKQKKQKAIKKRSGNDRYKTAKKAKSTTKKGKVSQSKKSSRKVVSRRSNKQTRRNTKKPPSVTVSKKYGSNNLDITFKNVRSISKKSNLIQQSESVNKGIDKMLKKNYIKGKGVKPPKGVVIIAADRKHNKGKVKVSPPEFVVNKKNIKGYITGIFEQIESEYDDSDFEDIGGDDDSDENVNPNGINSLTIKFIY